MNKKNKINLGTWGDGPTKFFFELGQEQVLQSLESMGFEPTGFCYPLNSYENRVYQVELEGPSKIVAKFYRPGRWSSNQLSEEHQWIADLSNADVPVSMPLEISGRTLFEVPEQEMFFCVYQNFKGRMLGEVPGMAYRSLGTWLARMHQVGALQTFKSRPTLSVASYGRASLASILSSKFFPSEMRVNYELLVSELFVYLDDLFDGIKTQRIHGDCHLGNILWNDFEPLFVDFDDSLSGPIVQDFWLLLPGRDDSAKAMLRELIDGYSALSEWDSNQLRLIEPLRALRLLHFQSWVLKRWDDPAFPGAFAQMITPVHWREHYQDLQEILLMLKGIESDPWRDL